MISEKKIKLNYWNNFDLKTWFQRINRTHENKSKSKCALSVTFENSHLFKNVKISFYTVPRNHNVIFKTLARHLPITQKLQTRRHKIEVFIYGSPYYILCLHVSKPTLNPLRAAMFKHYYSSWILLSIQLPHLSVNQNLVNNAEIIWSTIIMTQYSHPPLVKSCNAVYWVRLSLKD